MIELNSNKEKILLELSKQILSKNQVGNILNNPEELPIDFIEELSLETALKYWNGQMNYNDADCIMNNIFIFCNEMPGIAWECYLAFDAGEFYRREDERKIDPSEEYTRPLVGELLRKQKLIE